MSFASFMDEAWSSTQKLTTGSIRASERVTLERCGAYQLSLLISMLSYRTLAFHSSIHSSKSHTSSVKRSAANISRRLSPFSE